jgi:hypothetical protein
MIRTEDGNYVGKTEFASHLSNCVLQQTTRGRAGYEAKAFLAYGRLVAQWRLTHVGSDGERVFLVGTTGTGTLTLEGSELVDGVPSVLRLTYAAVDADRVLQRWERSIDNGSTWETTATFELARH